MVTRSHNEWFQPISRPATCPCGSKRKDRIKIGYDSKLYARGQYVNAKWRTVSHFCQCCFNARIIAQVSSYTNANFQFKLNARRGHFLPDWIRIREVDRIQKSIPFNNQLQLL